MKSSTKLERKTKRVEVIKNWFEIVAIFIGGLWAVSIFTIKEAPNFKKAFKVSVSLKIDSIENKRSNQNVLLKNECNLDFRVDVKNVGPNELYIDSMYVNIWMMPIDSVPTYDEYWDFNQLIISYDTIKYPKYSNLRLVDNGLIGHYPPENESGEDFDYKAPITKDSIVLISVELMGHGRRWFIIKDDFNLSNYAWKMQCVPDKKEIKREL